MRLRRQFTLGTQHLWPLIVLVAFGCLAALIPIDQVDFWWHMAIGRDIVANRSIPVVSNHSWALPANTPFIYGSWLSELLLYWLQVVGGIPLIVLARNVLLLVAYGLVGLEARRRSGSWGWAALAIGCAALMALNNVSVRPQMFAWVLFALTILVVGAYRSGQLAPRWLVAVPLLMIAWTNLHGTFALGLGFLGLAAGGETLARLVRRTQPVTAPRLLWLWLTTIASILAIFCNPRGIAIIDFVKNLVGHPAAQQFGGEWQPPDLLSFPGMLIPLTLLLAVLGWLRRPKHFDIVDALVLLAFGWLAISSIRNVIWFGMIAWPIAVGLLASHKPRAVRNRAQLPIFNYGIAAGLCVPLLMVQPPLKATLALGPAFSGMGAAIPDGIYIGAGTPVRAVEWLREQQLPTDTRLFHDMVYGSYLIWALPDVPVFVDGRIELYPYELWLRYREIDRGENALAGLAELQATHALLSRAGQAKLIDLLAAPGSGWREAYSDNIAVVFERIPQSGVK